jgi:hypothetical protein
MIYSGSCISRWIITISDRERRSDHYINSQSLEWYNGRIGICRCEIDQCIGRSGCWIVLCKVNGFCEYISFAGNETCMLTSFSNDIMYAVADSVAWLHFAVFLH